MTRPAAPASLTRSVWAIALPSALTNVATALFGVADMWAIGRLGHAPSQGAVELGAKFMMALLVSFNFLRTSTVALTAQAAGRHSDGEQAETLVRAIAVALAVGLALLLAMPVAIPIGLGWLGADGEVLHSAQGYVAIRYWAGPVWLVNAVLVGWLIGQRRVRAVLIVEIAANVIHIALDLLFVLVLLRGVGGVATATVLSELSKFAMLGLIVARQPAACDALHRITARTTWQAAAMTRLFTLNRDLFIRTVLLTGAIVVFARIGAQQGAVTLAANGILFQLFMIATMALDGFENAAQVLCGEAQGSRDRARFIGAIRASLIGGAAAGLVLAAAALVTGPSIAATFSTDPAVRAAALDYLGWVIVLPLAGFASYVLDGVFVGAAWTRALLLTMVVAVAAYAGLLWALEPLGNNGLWLSFTLLLIIRAAAQFAVLPHLIRREFNSG